MNTNEQAVVGTSEESAPKAAAPKKAVKKKVAKKKAAPKKKAAKKKVAAPKKKSSVKKVVIVKEELKASSMADALKVINKSEQKLGTIKVGGKVYSFTKRSTWAISKNLIKDGKDGLIMVIADEGHYVYPSKDYKELFGNIFKSGTWAKVGIYSQSTLPLWHEEYFTELK